MSSLSISQARRVALAAQGFADPVPKGRVDRRHFRRVMDRVALVQLDTVQTVARSHYLPHFSRLGAYDRAALDEWAWHDDECIEVWAHEASVVPLDTEPHLRWLRDDTHAGRWGWPKLRELMLKNRDYVESVYEEVRERGPLAASDLSDPRPNTGEWWGARSMGTWALDWMFRCGRLTIRRDQHFRKSFDLYERVVPEEVRSLATPSKSDAQRALIERSARSVGVGTASDIADYYRLPVKLARKRLEDLVEDGRVEIVDVEGWDEPAYLHTDARRPRRVRAAAMLSPFDPIVWNRARAARLFGFDYRIEIYTPAAKRQYGYYVLPFLLGDALVGRVDLKTDRKEGVLRVLGAWSEESADRGDMAAALPANLRSLAELVDADRAVVDSDAKGDVATMLDLSR